MYSKKADETGERNAKAIPIETKHYVICIRFFILRWRQNFVQESRRVKKY